MTNWVITVTCDACNFVATYLPIPENINKEHLDSIASGIQIGHACPYPLVPVGPTWNGFEKVR